MDIELPLMNKYYLFLHLFLLKLHINDRGNKERGKAKKRITRQRYNGVK